MPTVLDLCTKVGYPDAVSNESSGLAKVLLDDLKAFVNNEAADNDPDTMAQFYLSSPARIFRYPYSWTSDGYTVKEVISQLFSMIVQSRAMQGQVIDLEAPLSAGDKATTPLASIVGSSEPRSQGSDQVAPQHEVRNLQDVDPENTMSETYSIPVAKEDVPIMTVEFHDGEDGIILQNVMKGLVARGTSRDAGPITRLALREPTLVANLLRAGFREPFPATAPSEADLVRRLNGWMGQHRGRSPPCLRSLSHGMLGPRRGYAVTIFLATTSEEVHISIRQIGPSHMIYVLTDSDGSSMIVIPVVGNSMYRRGYLGWLWGDLGFTLKPIASCNWYRSPDPASDTVSNRTDKSIVVANQSEPHLPFDHEDNNTKQAHLTTQNHASDVEINLAEVHQATSRRDRAERQTQGRRRRSQTPPLSSISIIKKRKRHWPPQYVSPLTTPQPKERLASDIKQYKRRNLGGLLPNGDGSRTSSPEFVSESPVTAPQGRRRSTQGQFAGRYPILSPPRSPKKTRTTTKRSDVAEPVATAVRSSNQEILAMKDIKVHFFLSHESLGAVPATMNECDTVDTFFTQALSAWNLLGAGDHAGTMAAVSITVDGFQWPIVLPWGNATSFERMMETMAIAKTGKIGSLEVKVKCIKT